MTTYEIVGAVIFVLIVSLVSFYFGKYEGYKMGIMDAIDVIQISVERTLDAVQEEEEASE